MWTTYWYVVFFCLPSNKKRRRSVCPSVFSTTVHSINFTHGRCTAEGPGKCRVECEVVGWVVLRNSAVVIHYPAELQRPCSYRRSSFRCGSYMELSRETVHSSQTGFTLILANCTLINAFCMHRQSLVIWDPYIFFTLFILNVDHVSACYLCWLLLLLCFSQGSVEPMQIDADPQEDQQNAPDTNYIVENPTLVLSSHACLLYTHSP